MSPSTPTENKIHILVFKTNLRLKRDRKKVKPLLDDLAAIRDWNIDRDDRDKVLRIESSSCCTEEVITIINQAGYHCEELND